jgi:chromosomal replication initiation ATPase DnaA
MNPSPALSNRIQKTIPEYDRLRRERADEVIQCVCDQFGLYPAQITHVGRKPVIVTARAFVAMLLRIDGFLVAEIGAIINRHHSNVCHLLNETFPQAVNSPYNAKMWNTLLISLQHKK